MYVYTRADGRSRRMHEVIHLIYRLMNVLADGCSLNVYRALGLPKKII